MTSLEGVHVPGIDDSSPVTKDGVVDSSIPELQTRGVKGAFHSGIVIDPDEGAVDPYGNPMPYYSGPDFVPNKPLKREPVKRINTRVIVEPFTVNSGDRIIEVDYASHAQVAERSAIRDGVISSLAKRMYEDHESDRTKYVEALKEYKVLPRKEVQNPSNQRVRNILRLIAEGEPYSMDKCLEMARQQIIEGAM